MKKAFLILIVLCLLAPVSFSADSTTMFLTLGNVTAAPPSGTGTCDGQMLWLKMTPSSYLGNLGGITGANAICNTAYPGYHFCDYTTEVFPAGLRGCLPDPLPFVTVGAAAAPVGWINNSGGCSNWTSIVGTSTVLYARWPDASLTNYWKINSPSVCAAPQPLWCCK